MPRVILVVGAVATILIAVAGQSSAADAPSTLQLLPPQPTLTGPHATQRLVVEELRGGQAFGDLSAKAKLISANPEIATVDENGVVAPVSDGTATIRAEVDGRTVETQVVVKQAK